MKSIKRAFLAAIGLLGLVAIFALPAQADIQHLDDVIIQFSLCVGNDCVNGESFGFDTIRMKENNVRLHFFDTSTSASFPSNDWRIIANDSSNGGANYLAFEDSTAGRQTFRVEGGARANALYVESDGDIGIGTNNPVVDLHILTGNTPTIRLDQDGSSGFTAQAWDIAGNEANFFIRDATNGSKLPFRIVPNAPSESIYIANDGDIGMGAGTAPQDALHVRRTSGPARIRVENTSAGQAGFDLTNSAATWRTIVQSNGNVAINDTADSGDIEMLIELDGDVTIQGGLTTGSGGTCTAVPCDGVFRPEEYTVESIKEHAEYMWSNEHLRGVGPTPAGEPINLTHKTTGILHELEKAHIYIEQLHDRLATVEAKLAAAEATQSVD